MRRLVAVTVCACLILGAPAALAAKRSWAHGEIKLVTAQGLMGGNAASFRPDAPLTKRALADLVTELTESPAPEPGDPLAHATVATPGSMRETAG